jgi:hypothetical protein
LSRQAAGNKFAITSTSSGDIIVVRTKESSRESAMHREAMIDLLVLDCLEQTVAGRRGIWLLSILRDGFVGFAGMTDAQLAEEFARRGLLAREEMVAGNDDWRGTDSLDEWLVSMAAVDGRAERREY